jgi:hypothetical protein
VILSITPHVIRNLPVQTAASAEVVIGTESSLGRVPTSVRGGVLPAMLMPLLNRAPAAAPAQPASSSDNTAPAVAGKEKESNDDNNGVGLPKSLTYPLGQ